ncbi:MAG: DUF167 domain-containing protein [Qingshengfaniella sp.]
MIAQVSGKGRIVAGQQIILRVTPGASRERLTETEDGLRAWVTVPPEGGKANKAVQKLLAAHLGVPKSRLKLVRGAKSRDKVFTLLD